MNILNSVASSIDVILLSQSDPLHLGALPYAIHHFGLNGSLLCTLPVSKMGQMFLYDAVISHQVISKAFFGVHFS